MKEETAECPVCGERYFRYDTRADGIELTEAEVPLCVGSMYPEKGLKIYYHA